MRINHNIAALNTYRQLNTASTNQSKSMEKLSSGLRINKAGDDAAGLAISEKMRGQIRGLDQSSKNAQDGISFIQTAEGALNETHDILQRMRELAVQSSNDTNTDADRGELQKEVDQLAEEITRIANNTEFNTKSLLNGAVDDNGEKAATFHIGANSGQNLSLSIKAMDASSLGVARDVTTKTTTVNGSEISNVKLSDTVGAAIVDGANITFSAADNTGAKASATNVNGLDFTAKTAGNTLNNKTITIVQASGADQASALSVDGSGNYTFTIGTDNTSASLANTNTAFATQINSAISAYESGAGNPDSGLDTVTVNTGVTAGDAPTAVATTTAASLSGGAAANAAETIITIDDGNGNTQKVTVADTDTKVSVTSGAFNGLSFEVGDATALASNADTIDVGVTTEAATKATFANGKKTADAVAKAGIDISSQSAADTAITSINTAIETVSAERSKLGAVQNRLEHTINNLNTSSENLTAAESRIRDVDYALAA
ncbi:flagellin N-terminal helical domain-containing protein [Bacillus infantis]|uniref:flagellin N-terminal helical domain-containing protein n=1 Tax=Bacillus infantis TaxID=324767 RepID=UPI00384D322D